MRHTLLNLVLAVTLATAALLSAPSQPVVGAESTAMSICASARAGGRCTAIENLLMLDEHLITIPACDVPGCWNWQDVIGGDPPAERAEIMARSLEGHEAVEAGFGGRARSNIRRSRIPMLFDLDASVEGIEVAGSNRDCILCGIEGLEGQIRAFDQDWLGGVTPRHARQ